MLSNKRAADEDWPSGDPVRRALDDLNAAARAARAALAAASEAPLPLDGCYRELMRQNLASVTTLLDIRAAAAPVPPPKTKTKLPQLPSDCVRIIMELALGQRTEATFGPGGIVNRTHVLYGLFDQERATSTSIGTLRRVCRRWAEIGAPLVRAMRITAANIRYMPQPKEVAEKFHNVQAVSLSQPAYGVDKARKFCAALAPLLDAQWRDTHKITCRVVRVPWIEDFKERMAASVIRTIPCSRDGDVVRHYLCRVETLQSLFYANVWRFDSQQIAAVMMGHFIAMTPVESINNRRVRVQLFLDRVLQKSLYAALLNMPRALRDAIELHLIILVPYPHDLLPLQAFFLAPIVVHCLPKARKRFSAFEPHVYGDGTLYQKLATTQGILEPLIRA